MTGTFDPANETGPQHEPTQAPPQNQNQSVEFNGRAREIVTGIARRLPRYVQLATRLLRDDRITTRQKAPLLGAMGYVVSPIDLVPGIIPVVGQLDDLMVLLSALNRTVKGVPQPIADEHFAAVRLDRAQLQADLDDASYLTRQISRRVARGAASLAWRGARTTGRLARDGMRALRDR